MAVLVFFTILFFWFFPGRFPYNIEQYTKTGLLQTLGLLFATPWIYGFTYYMYSYRILRKIMITSLAVVYFIILGPFQYLLNACLIHLYSPLLMPLLHLYIGLLLNIFACIGFYAYGVSLENIFKKFK
jgi:hypothetical protein